MKVLAALVVLFLGAEPNSSWAQPSTPEEFITTYRTACQEKSIEKLNAITYMAGLSESDKKQMTEDAGRNFNEGKIVEVSLAPLPPDYQSTDVGYGIKTELNHPAFGCIKILYKENNGTVGTLTPYAIIGGHYFLLGSKNTDLGWKGPKDRFISFSVDGKGRDKVQITGKWNASGVEMEKSFHRSYCGVAGQYFENVTVTSMEDDADITLVLYVAGRKVYESQPLKGKGTLLYEKARNDKGGK